MLSCSSKREEVLKEGTSKQVEMTKLSVSKKNCFNNCGLYREYCEKLFETNRLCQSNLNEVSSKKCLQMLNVLNELEDQSALKNKICEETCLNVSIENPILVCEIGEKYKKLTSDVIQSILQSNDKLIKTLHLSKKIYEYGDEKFRENYDKLKTENKVLEKLPIIKIVEERRENDLFFEIWIKENEHACLPKKLKSYIKDNVKNGGSELDIMKFKKELLSLCDINELKFFKGKQTQLSDLKNKVAKITYYYKGSWSGDCGYSTPRIEIRYNHVPEGELLISKNYLIDESGDYESYAKFFSEYEHFYSPGFGSYPQGLLKYKNKKYMIFDEISMATSLSLYELKEFGYIKTGVSAWSEPCGS